MIGEVISVTPSGARIRADGETGAGLWLHRSAFGTHEPVLGDRVEYETYATASGQLFAQHLNVLTAEQAEVARCLG